LSLHLELLNPEQLAAVTLPDEHALILAGAGSGKTRVLTTRIAWLVKSGRVAPANILAVTFTNKAAREMLSRLTAMLAANPRGMWIGTFHGLCNRLLRAHHQEAGLPREFQILDSQDQLAAVKRLAKGLNVDEDRFPPREIQWFINGNKEEGVRAGDVPVAGELFKRGNRAMVKRELVFLIKPTVIQGDAQWRDDLAGTSERLRRMEAPAAAQAAAPARPE